jgi:hypothetical protein
MHTKPYGLRLSDAQRALDRAIQAKRAHAAVCMAWDYEDPEACLECCDLADAARKARETLERIAT